MHDNTEPLCLPPVPTNNQSNKSLFLQMLLKINSYIQDEQWCEQVCFTSPLYAVLLLKYRARTEHYEVPKMSIYCSGRSSHYVSHVWRCSQKGTSSSAGNSVVLHDASLYGNRITTDPGEKWLLLNSIKHLKKSALLDSTKHDCRLGFSFTTWDFLLVHSLEPSS